MSNKGIIVRMLQGLFVAALVSKGVATAAETPRVEQARGADQRVQYRGLTKFGPWDDRNYRLTREDLRRLSDDETEARDAIPAFFRVELRKEFPHLRRKGPAQYPRAAVPLFRKRYGALLVNGRLQGKTQETEGSTPVPVNGELQLNQVLGANEITVEINPSNPQQVIAGANNNGGQEMYYSSNGGETWTIQGTLPNTCCDPTVGWSSDGSVAYVAALSGSIGVSFWRSFDAGQTWTGRVDLTPGGSDKEFLHVDLSSTSPYQDNVYITYHNGNTMQFARSEDFGASWDITAFPAAQRGIGSDITTDSAGNIYKFYGAFNEREIVMLKSTDGGDSFEPPLVVAGTNGSFDWPIPAMESRRAWIYVATDADRSGGAFDGSVYAAWTDTIDPEQGNANANHTRIVVAFSRDGGVTWQTSVPHETADEDTVDRFNQWLTVDGNGVVHVVYYDTRQALPERNEVDLYYTFSLDGGVSWNEPQRISSETSSNLSDGQEWGDYNGISVIDNKIIPVWTDNRGGPPNQKDVYAADVENVTAGPNFILSGTNTAQSVCSPGDLNDVALSVGQILDFASPVSLSFADLAPGFTGGFSDNPVNPPGQSSAAIGVDASVSAGTYAYRIVASATGVNDRELGLNTTVFDAIPQSATLLAPADGSGDLSLAPTFSWSGAPQSAQYVFELDDDADFSSIEYTATVEGESHTIDTTLNTQQVYYWRVRATNLCGDAADSPVFSFSTGQLICSNPLLAIPDNSPAGISDSLLVGDSGTLLDLDVSVRIAHTYVGDLNVSLQNEETGFSALLIARPGYTGMGFGCDGNNIDATLDDEAASPVEDECAAGAPTIFGTFAPNTPLSVFDGAELAGTWTLRVSDNQGVDVGTLEQWCLLPSLEPQAVDTDGDGVDDSVDNCVLVANADQRDTNGDGFGNLCDGDLSGDCQTNFVDLGFIKSVIFTPDPDADLNGDGTVNFIDLGIFAGLLFNPPGPSGAPNACD